MSFLETLRRVDEGWRSPLLEQFGRYIAPGSPAGLESQAQMAAAVTRQHFGRTMRLFAPLYLSNECINNCSYCGFSRDNPILRVTLSLDQVTREARHLAAQGFRSILLVAGEHPKFVSSGYLEQCLERLRPFIPSLAIEVGPSEAPEYRRMVDAGAEGLVVYQETYHQEEYARLHTAGPKRDFAARLNCPERGYVGGFRRIGLGCLLGLADWRFDVLRLAAHLEHLLRHCWRANFTVSFPRLRPAAGSYEPSYHVTDEDYVRILTAFRLTFPQVGIVLSTREAPALRNALLPLGITAMSAGSHTEPGGYTGAGTDDLHLTVKGRRVDLDEKPCSGATGQFDIADDRTPAEISRLLQDRGFDPVWKDWDAAILDSSRGADKGIAPSVL
ncbi:MAG: 2-iminoacetate synthase ThiH [Verrucomicrobiales bacterium]|nr:2-iminoacetate synthase ThiH [Verrucomicrobiae bacterium]MCP5555436.1 2-iminoacetate synthase ThiH [Akkermansiaceae bacterium]